MSVSIRWKLLLLLWVITLVPVALLVWLDYRTTMRLATDLALANRERMVATAREELDKFADAQARAIAIDRTVLELVLRRQAREIGYLLATPVSGATRITWAADFDDPARAPPTVTASSRYHRYDPAGKRSPLPVSLEEPVFRLAPGVDTAAVAADIERLAALTPFYREVFSRHSNRVHWLFTSLANGVHTSYPGHGGYPPDFEPRERAWYRAARAERGLVWTGPAIDATTRQVTVTVSMPVYGPGGTFAGVTALDAPVVQMLREYGLPAKWSGDGRVLLVTPTPEGRLSVIAKQGYAETGGDWQAMLQAEFVPPTPGLADIVGDMQAGRGGLRQVTHGGAEQLWAYRSLDGRAWLMYWLRADAVAREADAVRDLTLASFARHMRSTVPLVLLIALGTAVVAYISARAVTEPLQTLARAADAIADGNFRARAALRTGDEFEAVGRAFDAMVPKLEERARLLESLALAREVQQRLLPHEAPRVRGLDLHGTSRYCDETGGDYYDFIDLASLQPGMIGFAIGDVSGHGLPSALLMATVRALLRSYVEQGMRPATAMRAINRVVSRDVHGGRYMTLMYVAIDTASRTLRWASAGHPPAIVYRAARDELIELGTGDIPLGVDPVWRYHDAHAEDWQPGDVALIGTDGIWETRAPDGELFGRERLAALLRAHHALPADALCERVLAEVDSHREAGPVTDDITLIVVRATA